VADGHAGQPARGADPRESQSGAARGGFPRTQWVGHPRGRFHRSRWLVWHSARGGARPVFRQTGARPGHRPARPPGLVLAGNAATAANRYCCPASGPARPPGRAGQRTTEHGPGAHQGVLHQVLGINNTPRQLTCIFLQRRQCTASVGFGQHSPSSDHFDSRREIGVQSSGGGLARHARHRSRRISDGRSPPRQSAAASNSLNASNQFRSS